MKSKRRNLEKRNYGITKFLKKIPLNNDDGKMMLSCANMFVPYVYSVQNHESFFTENLALTQSEIGVKD